MKVFKTTFSKMIFVFMVFGLIPILLLSIIFFQRYSATIRDTVVSNYSQIDRFFARNVGAIIEEVDEATIALYDYQAEAGESLALILEHSDLTTGEKQRAVNAALHDVLMKNEYISSVRFVDTQGNVYSQYRDLDKVFRDDNHAHTTMDFFAEAEDIRDLVVLGAIDESNICVNTDDYVFSLVRNYMDTTSIQRAKNHPAGTVFADINVAQIDQIVRNMSLDNGECYVYDPSAHRYLYSKDTSVYLDGADPLADISESLCVIHGMTRQKGNWYFYDKIENTGVYAVIQLNQNVIMAPFFQGRALMLLLLAFGCGFLLILYIMFSIRLSAPTVRLKEAMEEVEQGNLDVRVNLDTNDEMQSVAEGFNHMAESLKQHIEQVFVAEICQKDAELNALKMQIQPHYLYNTLDVIRMTALDQDDEKTAELLECLAHQLRYVMGEHTQRVTLREELEALREYFVIMRVRYEERIALNIVAADEDLSLYIPKLILQPMVENAIRHGLREKSGNGMVAIQVIRKQDTLEINVMDDGVGMSSEQVEAMREALENTRPGYIGENSKLSVGMKNTYDRIKLDCGKEYGYQIESMIGVGTSVTFRLPIWTE